jgi:hypothetical protein
MSKYIEVNTSQTDEEDMLMEPSEKQSANREINGNDESSHPHENANKRNPRTGPSGFMTGNGTPIDFNAHGVPLITRHTFTIPYAT